MNSLVFNDSVFLEKAELKKFQEFLQNGQFNEFIKSISLSIRSNKIVDGSFVIQEEISGKRGQVISTGENNVVVMLKSYRVLADKGHSYSFLRDLDIDQTYIVGWYIYNRYYEDCSIVKIEGGYVEIKEGSDSVIEKLRGVFGNTPTYISLTREIVDSTDSTEMIGVIKEELPESAIIMEVQEIVSTTTFRIRIISGSIPADLSNYRIKILGTIPISNVFSDDVLKYGLYCYQDLHISVKSLTAGLRINKISTLTYDSTTATWNNHFFDSSIWAVDPFKMFRDKTITGNLLGSKTITSDKIADKTIQESNLATDLLYAIKYSSRPTCYSHQIKTVGAEVTSVNLDDLISVSDSDKEENLVEVMGVLKISATSTGSYNFFIRTGRDITDSLRGMKAPDFIPLSIDITGMNDGVIYKVKIGGDSVLDSRSLTFTSSGTRRAVILLKYMGTWALSDVDPVKTQYRIVSIEEFSL